MKRFPLECLLIFAALMFVPDGHAQDRNDGFFDKDFVTGADSKRGGFFDSDHQTAPAQKDDADDEVEDEQDYRRATKEELDTPEPPKPAKEEHPKNQAELTQGLLNQEAAAKMMRQSNQIIEQLKNTSTEGNGVVDKEAIGYYMNQVKRNSGSNTKAHSQNTPPLLNPSQPPTVENKKQPMVPGSKLPGIQPATEPAVLGLVVNAYPEEHLAKYLRQLGDLKRRQNVEIGEVLVVYPKPNITSIVKSMAEQPQMHELLANLKGEHFALKPVFKVPESLSLKSSPAWIVQYNNQRYIFEGNYNPSRLFNYHGEFVAARDAADSQAMDSE